MFRKTLIYFSFIFGNVLFLSAGIALADKEVVDRGRYLVTVAGCNDCHTEAYPQRNGNVPETQWLKGSAVGYQGPWGTSYPANLRLSVANMSLEQFIARAKSELLPPMPWFNLTGMSDDDFKAIYHYIRSLGAPGEPMPENLPAGVVPNTPYIVFVPQEAAQN